MKRSIFFHLILNRGIIVLLALFSIMLATHINSQIQKGNASMYSMTQGDHIYTYMEPENPLLNMWAVWDTKWYVSIAEDGYSKQPFPYEEVDNKGFLPLYPFLIFIFSNTLFFGNTHLTGIILSNIFLFLVLYFLLKLIRSEPQLKDTVTERDGFLYLILFPTSYYLSAIYPESLFLLLSILVFYLVRVHKIIAACFIFSLACLTKTFGIFLAIPILHHLIVHRKEISVPKLIGSAVAALILPILYCAYMYNISGDPFAYIHIQEIFFSHKWSEPFGIIIKNVLTSNPYTLWTSSYVLFGLALLAYSFKKIPITYTLYGLCYILFTPLTGILSGSSRYLASLFVLPIALSVCIKKEETKNIIFMTFSMIQGFAILWWVIGAGFTS